MNTVNTVKEFVPATKHQLWALYCATHKDYRNQNLSKEEASEMIKTMMNDKKHNNTKVSIGDELIKYITDNFDTIFDKSVKSLKHKSVVVDDLDKSKKYAFIGVGCGITYLEFRKNNKRANEINQAANEFHNNGAMKMFVSKFTDSEYNYYKTIGNPLEALWSQDQGMQMAYYSMVVKFAESKGIKMKMHSVID